MTDALRIHYCLDKPRDDRRGRARCGHWVHSNQYTDEPERVTCKACRKLLALPPQSKTPAMNKLSSILPLALILSACGPLPADDLAGSTSSGDSSGESTGSTSGSTGEGSTSEAMDEASTGGSTGEGSTSGLTGGGASSSSGGEGSEASSTTGEPWMGGSCWAQECDDAAQPCREGLTCMEDPMHLGVKVCVAGCNGGDDCRVATLVCGELAPQGECRGTLCFPVTCEAVGDCPLGSTCDLDAGFCY